jgi:hypothetical protein
MHTISCAAAALALILALAVVLARADRGQQGQVLYYSDIEEPQGAGDSPVVHVNRLLPTPRPLYHQYDDDRDPTYDDLEPTDDGSGAFSAWLWAQASFAGLKERVEQFSPAYALATLVKVTLSAACVLGGLYLLVLRGLLLKVKATDGR